MTAVRSFSAVSHRQHAPRLALSVVDQKRPAWVGVMAAMTVVFGVLVITASLSTMLVSGQRNLDRIETQVDEGHARNQQLRLEVAQLESPTRIVAEARQAGMIDAPDREWIHPETLSPDEPPNSVSSVGEDLRASVETGDR